MSRLRKFFSKKKLNDDSDSDPNDELMSDAAEEDGSQHHSASMEGSHGEWGDWSVHDETNDSGEYHDAPKEKKPTAYSDETAPLNDTADGSAKDKEIVELSDLETKLEAVASSDSMDRLNKSFSNQSVNSEGKKKKKKKKKDGETSSQSEDPDKVKKKKKKDKSKSTTDIKEVGSFDSETMNSSVGDLATPKSADDGSIFSNDSAITPPEKKSKQKDSLAELKPMKKKTSKKDKEKKRSASTRNLMSTLEVDEEVKPRRSRSQSQTRVRSSSARRPTKEKEKVSKSKSKKAQSITLAMAQSEHIRTSVSEELASTPNSALATTESPAFSNDDAQRLEILRLHQMLSDALQKVASQSAEQIQDKDQFLRVSTELSRVRADFQNMVRERDTLNSRLEEKETAFKESVQKISDLQRDVQAQDLELFHVEKKLAQSEDEVGKLLVEIEDLERQGAEGGGVSDETLRTELKDAKKALVDKQREVDDQKSRVEHLEKELQDTTTVFKLQIEELEDEKRGLQGKLKGERLDLTAKLSQREESIATLENELARYRGNSEFEEIAVVRDELTSIKTEYDNTKNELESTKKLLAKVNSEKEDMIESNDVLNDKVKVLQRNMNELTDKNRDLEEKVLKWTEQTYDWKNRAAAAEKKLEAYTDGSDVGSDAGSETEKTPQGQFLQAFMDKKESAKKPNPPRWNLFGRPAEEDAGPEEAKMKLLEERNNTLTATIKELRSEMVKLQTTHKDEMYNIQKRIKELQEENEALKA